MKKGLKIYNELNSIKGLEIVKKQLDAISTSAPTLAILKNIFYLLFA